MLAVLAVAGCTAPLKTGKSPLMSTQMSPDSVVLDVFFARFPQGDVEVNEQLWQEVDEQLVPADLRKRLAQNGLRVGLVDGQMPAALSKLLELKDKPPPTTALAQRTAADLASQPGVEHRHMALRAGLRGQIVASEVYSQLAVLLYEPDGLCGQTYTDAQAMLAITQSPLGDGRVRLEVVPELHYEQPKQRWIGDQGTFRLEMSRDKRVFDSLAVSATLAPGAMLLMTSLPTLPGSLGHHFFAESHGQQKLLVIRLSQTQHNELYAPGEVLPLEEPAPQPKP